LFKDEAMHFNQPWIDYRTFTRFRYDGEFMTTPTTPSTSRASLVTIAIEGRICYPTLYRVELFISSVTLIWSRGSGPES